MVYDFPRVQRTRLAVEHLQFEDIPYVCAVGVVDRFSTPQSEPLLEWVRKMLLSGLCFIESTFRIRNELCNLCAYLYSGSLSSCIFSLM